MSIRGQIKTHLGQELFLLKPLIGGQKVGRTMFVSKEINNVAYPQAWPNNKRGERLAQMRAWLDTFTGGLRIKVAENPHRKPRDTFMARVEPVREQVFDIRCFDPVPGIRVLGRFAERDTFVALLWDYREHMNGRDFDAAVDRCIREWQRLFPNCPLFSGKTLNDYLSNYVSV